MRPSDFPIASSLTKNSGVSVLRECLVLSARQVPIFPIFGLLPVFSYFFEKFLFFFTIF